MYIMMKHFWTKDLEPLLLFIQPKERNFMQWCAPNPTGLYRQYISVMRSKDAHLYKSLMTILEVSAMNWQPDHPIELHMMQIGSEGCRASGRQAEQSTWRSKFVDLPGSSRNSVKYSCAIVKSSQVQQELPEACWNIVTWSRRVWGLPSHKKNSGRCVPDQGGNCIFLMWWYFW
jgi:hypothetical protein